MPIKPKAVYIYPLQVWLTSAIIGPIILFISTQINDHTFQTFIQFYWVAVTLGLIFSSPCFLLLLTGVIIVDWHPSKIYVKKLIIAVLAIVLAIAPFLLILGKAESILQKPNLIFVGSFVGPLLAAVFIYRWPNRDS